MLLLMLESEVKEGGGASKEEPEEGDGELKREEGAGGGWRALGLNSVMIEGEGRVTSPSLGEAGRVMVKPESLGVLLLEAWKWRAWACWVMREGPFCR